jgi:hypothetical protein
VGPSAKDLDLADLVYDPCGSTDDLGEHRLNPPRFTFDRGGFSLTPEDLYTTSRFLYTTERFLPKSHGAQTRTPKVEPIPLEVEPIPLEVEHKITGDEVNSAGVFSKTAEVEDIFLEVQGKTAGVQPPPAELPAGK